MESSPHIQKGSDPIPPRAERQLRDLVLENQAAARVFENLAMDYCCSGSQTLAEACKAANLPPEAVIAMIEKCDPAVSGKDWRREALADLARYIVDKHHAFTRAEIVRLNDLIAKVVLVHGNNHPELIRVQRIFAALSEELQEHMRKEEEMLFPYIAQLEEAARIKHRPPESMFGTVQNPVAMMMMEHEASGQALEMIRETTNNYAVPTDGCASYQTLYQALAAFAADLHQHIHLENNVLFPRAIELESQLS